MEIQHYSLEPEDLTEFLEGDEDDLGALITGILKREDSWDDPDRAIDTFIYGGMPDDRYTYDTESAEIEYAEFAKGTRLEGKIHLSFTASAYSQCSDAADLGRECYNTVDFRIESEPHRLVIWDTEKIRRDTTNEF